MAYAIVRVIQYCADNFFAEDDFKKSRATQDIVSISKLSVPNLETFFDIQGRAGIEARRQLKKLIEPFLKGQQSPDQ